VVRGGGGGMVKFDIQTNKRKSNEDMPWKKEMKRKKRMRWVNNHLISILSTLISIIYMFKENDVRFMIKLIF